MYYSWAPAAILWVHRVWDYHDGYIRHDVGTSTRSSLRGRSCFYFLRVEKKVFEYVCWHYYYYMLLFFFFFSDKLLKVSYSNFWNRKAKKNMFGLLKPMVTPRICHGIRLNTFLMINRHIPAVVTWCEWDLKRELSSLTFFTPLPVFGDNPSPLLWFLFLTRILVPELGCFGFWSMFVCSLFISFDPATFLIMFFCLPPTLIFC